MKYILASAAAGLSVSFVGAIVHDFLRMSDLGDSLVVAGLGYAGVSLCVLAIPVYKRVSNAYAHKDLFRLKEMLDKNIISQQEFDSKSRELKAKVL